MSTDRGQRPVGHHVCASTLNLLGPAVLADFGTAEAPELRAVLALFEKPNAFVWSEHELNILISARDLLAGGF